MAFFQELNKAIGPSLPTAVRKSLATIGQGISAVGAFAGALADLKVPGLGSIISRAAGLVGLFSIADELDVPSDKGRGFAGMANNQLRIHWVLNRLVHERFDQAQREEILRAALETAALDWAVHYAESCSSFFLERDDGSMRNGEPYVGEAIAAEFRETALRKIRAAAADRSLISHPQLTGLLFSWLRLSGRDAAEVTASPRRLEQLVDEEHVDGLDTAHAPPPTISE